MLTAVHLQALRSVTLLAVLLGVAGCGSKELQYPEDHARYVRIDKAVEALRQSYVKKDASGMASLMIPIDHLEQLQREAESDFETFQSIALDFRIERIMIENDDIDVYVHWQGVWKTNLDDPGLRQRGHSRLQWVGTKAILLKGVQGDVPFGMKGRQALGSQK
jgi:predicted small lipoprotein YifL